jgi:tetratricopeptide (TPR) repeat protein
MRAHYLINSERWTDPVVGWQLEAPNAGVVAHAMDAFASGYAAIRTGNKVRASQFHAELAKIAKAAAVNAYSGNTTVPGVLERELRALLMLEDGKRTEAVALLHETTKLEDAIPLEFGPPDIVKPSHELLGDVLLASGQAAEAQREFEHALALAPGRARSLLGLGRAALAAGDTTVARKALSDLKRNWHSADASLPEVAELNQLLARIK